jgi:sec-independent protein translocase protein TatA
MLGTQEIVLILALLLLVLGPKKLPEVARELGKAAREFNKASTQIAAEFVEPPSPQKTKTLEDLARNLGIEPEGRSRDDLLRDIGSRLGDKDNTGKNKEDTKNGNNRLA